MFYDKNGKRLSIIRELQAYWFFLIASISDVLYVADDADDAHRHEQRKGCGGNYSRVIAKPLQKVCLYTEGEEGNVNGRRKDKCRGDNAADDSHDKGCNHRHFVATDGGLLMLFDVFYSIQAFVERCHKGGIVIEMRFLSEEQFLKFFIFYVRHNA